MSCEKQCTKSKSSSLLDLLLAADLALFSLWRYTRKGTKTRPPLLKPSGEHLGKKKARQLFRSKVIFTSMHHADVTR